MNQTGKPISANYTCRRCPINASQENRKIAMTQMPQVSVLLEGRHARCPAVTIQFGGAALEVVTLLLTVRSPSFVFSLFLPLDSLLLTC